MVPFGRASPGFVRSIGALCVAGWFAGHQDRKLALEMLGDYRGKSNEMVQIGFSFTADDAAAAKAELTERKSQHGADSGDL